MNQASMVTIILGNHQSQKYKFISLHRHRIRQTSELVIWNEENSHIYHISQYTFSIDLLTDYIDVEILLIHDKKLWQSPTYN